MPIAPLIRRIACLDRLFLDIARMPVAHLRFRAERHPDHTFSVYRSFTRPHPRCKLFGHKALGAALIDLRGFAGGAAFLDSLRASAAARRNGPRRWRAATG